jgi:hypothetical protein
MNLSWILLKTRKLFDVKSQIFFYIQLVIVTFIQNDKSQPSTQKRHM